MGTITDTEGRRQVYSRRFGGRQGLRGLPQLGATQHTWGQQGAGGCGPCSLQLEPRGVLLGAGGAGGMPRGHEGGHRVLSFVSTSPVQQEGVRWLSPGHDPGVPATCPAPCDPWFRKGQGEAALRGWVLGAHNQPVLLKAPLSSSTWAGLSGARGARQGPP